MCVYVCVYKRERERERERERQTDTGIVGSIGIAARVEKQFDKDIAACVRTTVSKRDHSPEII